MGQQAISEFQKLYFQNEAKCKTFLPKVTFIWMRIKKSFDIIGFPLSLVKAEAWETRKWPVREIKSDVYGKREFVPRD